MSARKWVLLLCVVVLLLQGCATHGHADLGGTTTALSVTGGPGEVEQVRHGGELAVAIFFFVAVAIVFVAIVDVIILPYTAAEGHRPFPCCRAVYHACCH